MNCRTALAEAEIEYEMERSPSIYVKFPLLTADEALQRVSGKARYSCSSGPRRPGPCPQTWPLPSTPISRTWRSRRRRRSTSWSRTSSKTSWQRPASPITASSGRSRPRYSRNSPFKHPFIDRPSVVVFADYVAKDVGTGAVHIAPGHGEEDYETGLEYGLDVYSPVNEKGEFTGEVEFFKGMNVFEANRASS